MNHNDDNNNNNNKLKKVDDNISMYWIKPLLYMTKYNLKSK
jgi:hypothetical protein